MCGLTGFWNFGSSRSADALHRIGEAMAARIYHRGPDAMGVWCDEQAQLVLGHQRLAVIDLSPAGQQPMLSRSRRYAIVYNGEVYNAKALAQELTSSSIAFNGASDTEVVLAACEHWGVAVAAKRFIGMFAFALWDSELRELYLVRDRVGIKPLYWGFHNEQLLFSSELKAFFAHPQWRPDIDRDALTSYFRYGYIPMPQSIYRGIHKAEPGVITNIRQDGSVKQIRYWDFDQVTTHTTTEKISWQDQADKLDSLLQDAVKQRMISDVPLGAFLSGGIDSSTIVAMMQQQSHMPVKSFTIGFQESHYNEADCARLVAEHLGTDHHELMVSPQDALAVIPDLPTWYDEPFADSSQIPTYLVAKLARETVTVSLSGDGGDELFAGYSRYWAINKFWSYCGFLPLTVRKLLARGVSSLSPERWQRIISAMPKRLSVSNATEKLDKLITMLKSEKQSSYQAIMSFWSDPAMIVQDGEELYHWQNKSDLSLIEQMQRIDTLTYLPDDILTKVDRASMAVSLEARVPLLDHRIIEMAWQLPMDFKLRGNHGKWLLKQVLSRYVPNHLTNRPKMGFAVPVGDWLRGPLRDWAESLLDPKLIDQQGILHSRPIEQCWQAHLKKRRNFSYLLWQVLMFQAWYQRWIAMTV